MSPCLRVLCAKYFAMRAQNTPISVILRLLGEFFRGTAAVGAVWGEFFAELLWTRACCASFFAELPPEGPCWASLFVDQQSLDPAGRGVLAAVLASGPFYWLQCASEPT